MADACVGLIQFKGQTLQKELPPLLVLTTPLFTNKERNVWHLEVRNRRTHHMCSASISASPLASWTQPVLALWSLSCWCVEGGKKWTHQAPKNVSLAPNDSSSKLQTGIVESA